MCTVHRGQISGHITDPEHQPWHVKFCLKRRQKRRRRRWKKAVEV